jgi:2-dehydropantoate 2-reductase
MRIAIIGGGAIGSLVAARLVSTDATVSLVVRRAEAARTINAGGIRMTNPDGSETVARVSATADAAALPVQDVVILCTKAYALVSTLPAVAKLSGPRTVVVPLLNGVPWWYPAAQPAPLAGRSLASVDPDGALKTAIPEDHIVGALTYVAVLNRGDGSIHHVGNQSFIFGDPAGRMTPELAGVAEAFRKAGFDASVTPDIRSQIWTKLWGNLAFNPLSVLTQSSSLLLCTEPAVREVAATMMAEGQAVAERLGVRFAMTIPARIDATAQLGDFKTSMLQDYEAGRRLELDAIVGAVIELAEIVDVAVQTLRTVRALVDLRARAAPIAR